MSTDAIFKALADKTRRKLLDRLCERSGQNLSELCESLKMTRQAVMKHLAILENANLISTEWNGREKLHFLNPVPIQETYGRWIEKFEKHQLQVLDRLKRDLESQEQKPKRRKK